MTRSQNRPDITDHLGRITASRPKGEQVYEHLVALTVELPPGALLPSERVLAEEFGVARPTVRNQLDELVRQGLAIRRIGSGTFTAEPRLPIAPTLPSFSREILALGMTPGTRLLSARNLPADDALALALGVEPASPILEIVRLRTANEEPLALEHTRLSLRKYPGLDQQPLDKISLRDHLRDTYGAGGTRAERRFTIAAVGERDAALLDVVSGTAAFRAGVTIYEADDSVVEVSSALLRADRYEIRMDVDTLAPALGSPQNGS